MKIGENKGKNVKEMGMVYFYCVEIHRELDWDMGVCINSLRHYTMYLNLRKGMNELSIIVHSM